LQHDLSQLCGVYRDQLNHTNYRQAEMKAISNDVDTSVEARAVHRVVRAMHDGECPACHKIFSSEQMVVPGGRKCPNPSCGFSVAEFTMRDAIREFGPYMDENLRIFRNWRNHLRIRRTTEAENEATRAEANSNSAQPPSSDAPAPIAVEMPLYTDEPCEACNGHGTLECRALTTSEEFMNSRSPERLRELADACESIAGSIVVSGPGWSCPAELTRKNQEALKESARALREYADIAADTHPE
jgi:hypothetical protein